MKTGKFFIVIIVVTFCVVASWMTPKPKVVLGKVTSVIDYSNYQRVSVDTTGDGARDLVDEPFNYKFRGIERLSQGNRVKLIIREGILLHSVKISRLVNK